MSNYADYATPVQDHLIDQAVEDTLTETRITRLEDLGPGVGQRLPGADHRTGISLLTEVAELVRAFDGVARDRGALRKEAARIGRQMANEAFYQLPNMKVAKPTVWLMEALRESYGYLLVDVQVTAESDTTIDLTVTAVDMLSGNISRFPGRYGITPAPGKYANKADQRERWRTMQANMARSKAIRTCLEHTIPVEVWRAAVNAAQSQRLAQVLAGPNGVKFETVSEAIRDVLGYIEEQGVSRARVAEAVGRDELDWGVEECLRMRELAWEGKQQGWEQAFPAVAEVHFDGTGGGLAGMKAKPMDDAEVQAMVNDPALGAEAFTLSPEPEPNIVVDEDAGAAKAEAEQRVEHKRRLKTRIKALLQRYPGETWKEAFGATETPWNARWELWRSADKLEALANALEEHLPEGSK